MLDRLYQRFDDLSFELGVFKVCSRTTRHGGVGQADTQCIAVTAVARLCRLFGAAVMGRLSAAGGDHRRCVDGRHEPGRKPGEPVNE
jgi:hypothetical protein